MPRSRSSPLRRHEIRSFRESRGTDHRRRHTPRHRPVAATHRSSRPSIGRGVLVRRGHRRTGGGTCPVHRRVPGGDLAALVRAQRQPRPARRRRVRAGRVAPPLRHRPAHSRQETERRSGRHRGLRAAVVGLEARHRPQAFERLPSRRKPSPGCRTDGDAERPGPERPCDAEPDEAHADPPGHLGARAGPCGPSRAHVQTATPPRYVWRSTSNSSAPWLERRTPSGTAPDRLGRWLARTKALRKRQRAYGSGAALRYWIADRAMQLRETPCRLTPGRGGVCPFSSEALPDPPVRPEVHTCPVHDGTLRAVGVGGPGTGWHGKPFRYRLAQISYGRGNGIACVRGSTDISPAKRRLSPRRAEAVLATGVGKGCSETPFAMGLASPHNPKRCSPVADRRRDH